MKEELQTKMVEILSSIQTAAGKASDFALEQLPDIAQSYVAYGRASVTLSIIMSVALLFAVAWLFKWTHHKVSKEDYDAVIWFPTGLAGSIAAMFLTINLFIDSKTAMLVWFAPKVWLLKELASLIK